MGRPQQGQEYYTRQRFGRLNEASSARRSARIPRRRSRRLHRQTARLFNVPFCACGSTNGHQMPPGSYPGVDLPSRLGI